MVENHTGGNTEYVFTSADESSDDGFPDLDNSTTHTGSCADADMPFLGQADHFPHASKTSFDYKRGLLISEKVFNNEESGSSLQKYSIVNDYQFNSKGTASITLALNTGKDGDTGETTLTRTINSDFIALKKQTETLDGVDETITDLWYINTIALWPGNTISKLREKIIKITDFTAPFSEKRHETEYTYTIITGQNRIEIEKITDKVDFETVDETTYTYATFGGLGPFVSTVQRRENTFDADGDLQTGANVTQVTYNNYNIHGKPESITGKGEPLAQTFTYTHFGEIDTESHSDFNKSYTYYDNHLVESTTDIDGQVVYYEYDPLMRIKTIKEHCSEGDIFFVCASSDRQPSSLAEICKRKINYTYSYYNEANNIDNTIQVENTYKCDDQYNKTITKLDGLGRTISITKKDHADIGGNIQDVTTSSTYNNRGLLATQTDAEGNVTTYDYYGDPLDRLKTITDPMGFITTKLYRSNVTNEIADYAANTLNKETTEDADGISTTVYTDRLGRAVAKMVHQGTQKSITYTKYDDKNRVIRVLPPGTDETMADLIFEYTYDGADNMTSKKVPDKGLMEYWYDERDLEIAMNDENIRSAPGVYRFLTEYDDFGRIIRQGLGFTPGGLITNIMIENLYDKTGSPDVYSGRLHKSIANIISNGYYVGDDNIITDYTFDDFGRVETETYVNHLGQNESKAYTYDAADKILTVTHTIGDTDNAEGVETITSYTYDVQGRLSSTNFSVDGVSQPVSDLTYTLNDLMDTKTLGGGMQTLNYSYNNNNWLTGINKDKIALAGVNIPVCPTVGSQPVGTYLSTVDLFALDLRYNDPDHNNARMNGNIAEMHWRVHGRQSDYYNFTYDYLNRLESATSLNDNFNTAYTYDARGNIQTLKRNGLMKQENCYQKDAIDDLKYTYLPGTNQIKKVIDYEDCKLIDYVDMDPQDGLQRAADNVELHKAQKELISEVDLSIKNKRLEAGEKVSLYPGFSHTGQSKNFSGIIQDCNIGFNGLGNASNQHYFYDENGNLTGDENKGFTISYNYLNLPYEALKDDGSKIEWMWTADGRKLQKKTTVQGGDITTKDYLNEVELKNGELQAAYHSEGRYVADNSSYNKWEFNLKDHLGNVRLVFTGQKPTGASNFSVYIKQENHYYPFGMPISGPWYEQNEKSDYLYNGKEYNTDLGLNWSDYGARFYDPQIGRFISVDPSADLMPSHSTYSYSFNNPVNYTDPDGQIPLAVILAWAGKRAAAGVIADIVVQLATEWVFNGGSLSDAWSRLVIDKTQVILSAGENIVRGKFTAAAISAGNDLVGYIWSNENWTWEGAFIEAGEGAISSLLGDKLGKLFLKKLRNLKVGKKVDEAVENVVAETSMKALPSGGSTVKHHIFNVFRGKSSKSQVYRDFFKKHGIDLDANTIHIPENLHKKLHAAGNNWTTKWKRWIDAHPNATTKQVYQQAGKMMDEYGVSGYPILPYK